jgi:hypothetical protein
MTAYEIAAKLNAAPTKVTDRTYTATVWQGREKTRVYVKESGQDIGYIDCSGHSPDYSAITKARAAVRQRVERS